jgi:hypothetical protein
MPEEKADPALRIRELEDALKEAERRLAEMKAERDDAQQLVEREREHVEDADALIDSWIEAFGMQLGDDGNYFLPENITEQYEKLLTKYADLAKRWNRFVPKYNAAINPQPVGRPLAASNAQCSTVLKLHKTKVSLRGIADETSLSLRTVRTIIGRDEWTDRATLRRLEKIDPDHPLVAAAKARKRVRDGLPKRIGKLLDAGAALTKEAKGLGKK